MNIGKHDEVRNCNFGWLSENTGVGFYLSHLRRLLGIRIIMVHQDSGDYQDVSQCECSGDHPTLWYVGGVAWLGPRSTTISDSCIPGTQSAFPPMRRSRVPRVSGPGADIIIPVGALERGLVVPERASGSGGDDHFSRAASARSRSSTRFGSRSDPQVCDAHISEERGITDFPVTPVGDDGPGSASRIG